MKSNNTSTIVISVVNNICPENIYYFWFYYIPIARCVPNLVVGRLRNLLEHNLDSRHRLNNVALYDNLIRCALLENSIVGIGYANGNTLAKLSRWHNNPKLRRVLSIATQHHARATIEHNTLRSIVSHSNLRHTTIGCRNVHIARNLLTIITS